MVGDERDMSTRSGPILSSFVLWAVLTSCQTHGVGESGASAASQASPSKDTPHIYSDADDLGAAVTKAVADAKTFHLDGQVSLELGPGSAVKIAVNGDYKIGSRGLDFRAIMTSSNGTGSSGQTEMMAVDTVVYFRDPTMSDGEWSDGIEIGDKTEWGTVQNPLTFVKLISGADAVKAEADARTARYDLSFDPKTFFHVLNGGGDLPSGLSCTATGHYSLTKANLPTKVAIELTCSGQIEGKIAMSFGRWRSPVSVVAPRQR